MPSHTFAWQYVIVSSRREHIPRNLFGEIKYLTVILRYGWKSMIFFWLSCWCIDCLQRGCLHLSIIHKIAAYSWQERIYITLNQRNSDSVHTLGWFVDMLRVFKIANIFQLTNFLFSFHSPTPSTLSVWHRHFRFYILAHIHQYQTSSWVCVFRFNFFLNHWNGSGCLYTHLRNQKERGRESGKEGDRTMK